MNQTTHHRLQIIQSIEHIGTSPRISMKIMREVDSLDTDMNQVAQLIRDDPTICAQVLKIANSAYFTRGERINSVVLAVVKLGLENIKKILFAIEIIGVFKGQLSPARFSEESFWKHSIAGGTLAADIGKTRSFKDDEILYLAGILRNIGVLVIRQFMPAEFEAILMLMEHGKMTFGNAAKEIVGLNHREIAYLIGMRWNLPEGIVFSIGEKDGNTKESEPISLIRSTLLAADSILTVKKYAQWDPYSLATADLKGIDVDAVWEKSFAQVEKLYQDLHV